MTQLYRYKIINVLKNGWISYRNGPDSENYLP